MKPTPLLLLGGGGHCAAVVDVIEATQAFEIVGIIESTLAPPEALSGDVLGVPVVGTDRDLKSQIGTTPSCLVTVGQMTTSATRAQLFQQVQRFGGDLPTLVSPLAHVAASASLGAGTVVMHQALVNARAKVGVNCIINSKALVEHDAHIGDHTHISTGAIVNGGARIGRDCMIGSGAVIKQGVQIADHVIIGAGARIVKNITRPGCYVDLGRELNQVIGL
ncbi:MAG: NeuD/PglB/VioB family sugar acetyltransferase [Hydrogenovibrio sp.]